MSEPIHHPSGSVWRLWDLHFHTPSSYDVGSGAMTSEKIVETLVVMPELRSWQLPTTTSWTSTASESCTRLGAGQLVVLPGIEVPTELGGNRSVHVVAVFSEDCDLDETWNTLQVNHGLSPRQVESIGDESVFVDCAEFCDTVHELGGVVVAHAGTKCNGIEEIGNSTGFKQALKTGLARDSIDIFEIAGKKRTCRIIGTLSFLRSGRCFRWFFARTRTASTPMLRRVSPAG